MSSRSISPVAACSASPPIAHIIGTKREQPKVFWEFSIHLGVLSHQIKYEMKSPHLVDFSWDLVDY